MLPLWIMPCIWFSEDPPFLVPADYWRAFVCMAASIASCFMLSAFLRNLDIQSSPCCHADKSSLYCIWFRIFAVCCFVICYSERSLGFWLQKWCLPFITFWFIPKIVGCGNSGINDSRNACSSVKGRIFSRTYKHNLASRNFAVV